MSLVAAPLEAAPALAPGAASGAALDGALLRAALARCVRAAIPIATSVRAFWTLDTAASLAVLTALAAFAGADVTLLAAPVMVFPAEAAAA